MSNMDCSYVLVLVEVLRTYWLRNGEVGLRHNPRKFKAPKLSALHPQFSKWLLRLIQINGKLVSTASVLGNVASVWINHITSVHIHLVGQP